MTFPNWTVDDDRAIQYSTRLVREHGLDARALDWGSRESQNLRFAALARVGSLQGASILDIGCGQGDLFAWFQEQGFAVKYSGIDITPSMIDVARQRFPDQHFAVGNVLDNPPTKEAFDYVIASGVFYLRQVEPFAFMQAMVQTLFRACGKALAFNSLSAWSPVQDEGEYYADPMEVVSWCRQLTSRLSLLHDYHPRDFSVFLYH